MKYTKFLRGFNSEGVWTHDSRTISIPGPSGSTKQVDMDKYAKEHGIELPDAKKSKKQINKDIEEKSYGDMESPHASGSPEEHGDGNSESTE